MSEFKFACPVCGQHITADSTTSGSHTDCPTCFRSLVVPQAPASSDQRLIVTAMQAKARPTSFAAAGSRAAQGNGNRRFRLQNIALGALLCATAVGLYLFRGHIFKTEPHEHEPEPAAPPAAMPWTLDLSEAVLEQSTVSGRIHGREFRCDQATLQGGKLTLAQGNSWPPELGITISFYVQESEKLSGKSLEVAPDRAPPLPKVVLRWKNEQGQGVNRTFHSGYALRLAFRHPVEGRMPGVLFIALPDAEKSYLSGTFEAVIRKPAVRSPPEGSQKLQESGTAPR